MGPAQSHRCFCLLQPGSSMADDLDIEAMLEAPYRKVRPPLTSRGCWGELAGLCCSQVRLKFGSTRMQVPAQSPFRATTASWPFLQLPVFESVLGEGGVCPDEPGSDEQLSFCVCEQQDADGDGADGADADGGDAVDLPQAAVNKRVSLFVDLPNDFSPLLP